MRTISLGEVCLGVRLLGPLGFRCHASLLAGRILGDQSKFTAEGEAVRVQGTALARTFGDDLTPSGHK